MKFEGVIFDLDGTLVDSLEDIADSMNSVLQGCGFPSHDLRSYKRFIGNGIKNLVSEALPETFRTEELIDKCYNFMVEKYRYNFVNKTRPYDGIAEMLTELTARKIILTVFSNKADELTKKVVKALLPSWKFEAIIGSSNDIPRKPNPFGALLISRQLSIAPENLIYVGDSDLDMQTANSAGMYAVGALWGYRTKEELVSNGAQYLLYRPLDLIKLL
ncbi:MAG: Phosphoglycolate phosphatase [Pelotomaculum sp. PtaB.Bin013]|uniref:HAD family hydrolase n=1 Tax=Pelotomaculum isophthalicicum JI TaxID=947010 RepID=A0A9X4H7K0_9FIRM|nr:HAD family hydrolase [Pelotomaculum isophthalicicum]MDF9409614.1 HAD family hydrolase [Pelotomaculum isophthalicicum JI]OPX81433.1 MAG: Phosphoglycolate phosphatase [Pelotomaculum sp. PtaB.Bin013]